MCSMTLLRIHVRVIGLSFCGLFLEPFLKIGFTMAFFPVQRYEAGLL